MNKPFHLTPDPETKLDAFRRIAAEHGYTIGADGKMTDAQFHPEPWPDGQPKEFVGPSKAGRGDTVLVASVMTGAPPELVGICRGFEGSDGFWIETYLGIHLYGSYSIIKILHKTPS